MWYGRSCVAMLATLSLMVGALANPVRRSPDLEARRRSAIDRSMIRLGRSPSDITAADIREALQRPSRRGNSFLRLGRSQPVTLTSEDIISLLRAYSNEDEDNNSLEKRGLSFVRLGRDPKFIRFGRSPDEEKPIVYEQNSDSGNGYPQRKNRARDHFVRLGRESEELNDTNEDEELFGEERSKRSVDTPCQGCQS